MQVVKSTEYCRRLKSELEQRCQHNARYSLRSFARDIGMSPGRLSEILRGNCGLSTTTAGRIAKRLGWSTHETKYFINLVEAQHARSPLRREMAKKRLLRYQLPQKQKIHEDALCIIKDWYHLAILELLCLKNAKSDVTWIAKALEISEIEAQNAIERLLRVGQLKQEGKRLVPTEDFSATSDGVPSVSIRHFQKQILEKALAALHLQTIDERNITTTIMAFDSKSIDEAKAKMRTFRFNFNDEFGSSQNSDSVYCLAMQLFRLTPATLPTEER